MPGSRPGPDSPFSVTPANAGGVHLYTQSEIARVYNQPVIPAKAGT